MQCAFCLYKDLKQTTARPAVTTVCGTATCLEHLTTAAKVHGLNLRSAGF